MMITIIAKYNTLCRHFTQPSYVLRDCFFIVALGVQKTRLEHVVAVRAPVMNNSENPGFEIGKNGRIAKLLS